MIDLEKLRQIAFNCCKNIVLSWLVTEHQDAVWQDQPHTAETLSRLIDKIKEMAL